MMMEMIITIKVAMNKTAARELHQYGRELEPQPGQHYAAYDDSQGADSRTGRAIGFGATPAKPRNTSLPFMRVSFL
jgi:hypothetical protein